MLSTSTCNVPNTSTHTHSEEAVRRARKLARVSEERLQFIKVDLCDAAALHSAFEGCPDFLACIHFAGLKAVGESVKQPLMYFENNMISTLNLLKELAETACRSFVFSSSATVYGTAPAPITEDAQVGVGITNPYGKPARAACCTCHLVGIYSPVCCT